MKLLIQQSFVNRYLVGEVFDDNVVIFDFHVSSSCSVFPAVAGQPKYDYEKMKRNDIVNDLNIKIP